MKLRLGASLVWCILISKLLIAVCALSYGKLAIWIRKSMYISTLSEVKANGSFAMISRTEENCSLTSSTSKWGEQRVGSRSSWLFLYVASCISWWVSSQGYERPTRFLHQRPLQHRQDLWRIPHFQRMRRSMHQRSQRMTSPHRKLHRTSRGPWSHSNSISKDHQKAPSLGSIRLWLAPLIGSSRTAKGSSTRNGSTRRFLSSSTKAIPNISHFTKASRIISTVLTCHDIWLWIPSADCIQTR